MTYETSKQLRDADGNLLKSQYYDSLNDKYVPGGAGGGGGGGDASAANQTATLSTVTPGAAPVRATLIAGQYNSTLPAPTNGQSLAIQANSNGVLLTQIVGVGGAGPAIVTGNADAVTPANGKFAVAAYPYLYNGATVDRMPGNTKGVFTTQSPQAGTDRSLAVATTAANILPANATRSRYILQNNGTTNIYIAWGITATVGGLSCMRIGPGQSYVGDSDTVAISAIAETSSCNVFAREW